LDRESRTGKRSASEPRTRKRRGLEVELQCELQLEAEQLDLSERQYILYFPFERHWDSPTQWVRAARVEVH